MIGRAMHDRFLKYSMRMGEGSYLDIANDYSSKDDIIRVLVGLNTRRNYRRN